MKTLLKNARTIVTCDDADSILHGADVLLEDGVIRSIGSLGNVPADEVVDASRWILYPGLINTHHHLYQYFTRNLRQVQNLELFDWLTALYGIWAHLNEDTVRLSSLCGMGELMKYGCTTCFDHHYVFPTGRGTCSRRSLTRRSSSASAWLFAREHEPVQKGRGTAAGLRRTDHGRNSARQS